MIRQVLKKADSCTGLWRWMGWMQEGGEPPTSASGQDRPGVESQQQQRYSSGNEAGTHMYGEQTNTSGEEPKIWGGQMRFI